MIPLRKSEWILHTSLLSLLYKITLKSPNPRETSESMNFNVIDIKNN
jgi:hypothetical protein